MPLSVIVNSKAGGMSDAMTERTIRDAFAKAGSDASVVVISPKDLAATLRSGLAGSDVIYVGGGDGTLTTAARLLAGTRTALGPLPLGTRNHFARDLEIPLGIDDAARALVGGDVIDVDVGEVNGIPFINNVSIGLYPLIVAQREWHERAGRSRAMAFLRALVNVFWSYPMEVLRLRWGTDSATIRTPFALVGNNEYVTSSADFGRRTSLTEGALSLYYAPHVGRFRFLWTTTKALFSIVPARPHLEKIITADLVVESRRREIEAAIDGDVQVLATPLAFAIRPRALRVVVPRSTR